MDASKTKDMIILKDLPSNIVKEAYVVLKPNVKQKLENTNKDTQGKWSGYIVKEAENVINNYLSEFESNKKLKNIEMEKIKRKYKKLKKFCMGLVFLIFINILKQIGM